MNTKMKKFGVAFLGLAMLASIAAGAVQKASAHEDGNKNDDNKNKIGIVAKAAAMLSAPEMQVGSNGKVIVRGAKVTALSGSAISAQLAFGSFTTNWTVKTDANTEFIHRFGGKASLADVKVGDTLSFSGTLDTGAAAATVNAKVVKDWSNDKPVNQPVTLQGSLKAIGSTATPASLTVRVNDTDYAVNVTASTAILNRLWLATALANFKVGDTVRFYGLVTGTAADATVVRDISIP